MKRILMLLIMLLVLIIGCMFKMQKKIIVKPNLSEEEFLHNIETVYSNYNSKLHSPEISILKDKFAYQNSHKDEPDYKIKYEELGENKIALWIYSGVVRSDKPIEVEASFAVWRYLSTINFDETIVAITCSYLQGKGYADWTIAIKKDQYEEIKRETDITNLKDKEIAKKYAEKWIEKTGYKKY